MRKTFTKAATAALSFFLLSGAQAAGPITMIVTVPPGGSSDALARVTATALGARLNAREGDEVSEGGVVTFHGRFLTGDLGEAILVYNPADEKGETSWVDATAGRIIGDLLAAAQARGALTHLHWSFTAAVDSTGTAWATTTSPGSWLISLPSITFCWLPPESCPISWSTPATLISNSSTCFSASCLSLS